MISMDEARVLAAGTLEQLDDYELIAWVRERMRGYDRGAHEMELALDLWDSELGAVDGSLDAGRCAMSRPWHIVTRASAAHAGRGSVLGPDTPRRTRWRVLTLECGHKVQRPIRYKPDESIPKGWRNSGGWGLHRHMDDALPPPEAGALREVPVLAQGRAARARPPAP